MTPGEFGELPYAEQVYLNAAYAEHLRRQSPQTDDEDADGDTPSVSEIVENLDDETVAELLGRR